MEENTNEEITEETKINEILEEIKKDLSDNYYDNDDTVLKNLLEDVIADALSISNRKFKSDKVNQIEILSSNIKKAVKTIYIQRGTEDVKSSGEAGESKTYADSIEIMEKDIIRQNKRIMI